MSPMARGAEVHMSNYGGGAMEVEVPLTIECVDCLGICHRLPREPEGGFAPGEVIAYRCEDCLDRWDIQFGPEEASP